MSGPKRKRSGPGAADERSQETMRGALSPTEQKPASSAHPDPKAQHTAPTSLIVSETAIRRDAAGRFSLNDLHRAAGGNRRFGPGRWTRSETYRALVDELKPEMAFAPASSIRGGSAPGTYVCEELVFAYAMWISPSFHIRVIRAYKQQTGDELRARDSLLMKRLELERWDASSKQKASIGSLLLHERRRELPTLRDERAALEAAMQPGLFSLAYGLPGA